MPNRNLETEIGNINRRMPYVSFIRRPTSADIRNPETGRIYSTPYFWRVKNKDDGTAPDTGSAGELWYLEDITANVSEWKQMIFAAGASGIISISGDAGGSVTGNGAGDMDLFGLVVASGTRAKPVFVTGTPGSFKQEIEVQVAKDRTGAPLNTNDVGLCSFDDTSFVVNSNGYVTLIGGGVTPPTMSFDVNSNTAPGTDPTVPTLTGAMGIKGAAVAAHSIPVETHARVANEFNVEVQVASAVTGDPGTTVAAGLAQFDDTSFAVTSEGYVTFTGGVGTHIDTVTGDSGGAIGPDGASNIGLTGLTVANATNAKPVSVEGAANAQVVEVQVATEVTGAPADSNDAGIASYNDTQFAVDANGYVTLVGAADLPSVQTLTGDDAVVTGPDASGNLDMTGLTVANATNAKPVYVNGGTNSEVVEVQVGTAVTGAPADKNDAGIVSFDDTSFAVNADGYVTFTGGGLTWVEVTGTTQAAAINTGYVTNNAGLVTITLPTTAAFGSIVKVVGKGAGGWKIAQNAGETIHWLSVDTTTGVGGSLASTTRYDSVELLCTLADTDWTVISNEGNITPV